MLLSAPHAIAESCPVKKVVEVFKAMPLGACSHFFTLNAISMVMSTGTGLLSFMPGLNCH